MTLFFVLFRSDLDDRTTQLASVDRSFPQYLEWGSLLMKDV